MYTLKDYISQLKDLFSICPDRIIVSDVSGKINFINEHFLSASGFDKKDKPISDLNSLIGSSAFEKINEEIADKYVNDSEVMFNFLKGKKKLRIICFNVWNNDLAIGKVFVNPVGEKSEGHLKNNLFQNSILRAMNSRNDAVWFMTNIQAGKSYFTSESVRDILGWEPDSFNYGSWAFFFSLVHPDDIPNLFQRHSEWVLMKNKLGALYDHVQYTNSFRVRNIKGEYVPIATESNVLERDDEGKLRLIFGSFRLVDLKTMKERLAGQPSSAIKFIDGKTYIELDYLKQLREQKIELPEKRTFKNLSLREMETLELIVQEFTSEEISKKLNISIHTVNLHRKQIMKKLEAKNVAALMKIYYTSR